MLRPHTLSAGGSAERMQHQPRTPTARPPAVAAAKRCPLGLLATAPGSQTLPGLKSARQGVLCSAGCCNNNNGTSRRSSISSGGWGCHDLQKQQRWRQAGRLGRGRAGLPAVQHSTALYGKDQIVVVAPAPSAPAVAVVSRLGVVVACLPPGSSELATHGTPGAFAGGSSRRVGGKAKSKSKGRRSPTSDSAAPSAHSPPAGAGGAGGGGGTPITSGPAPSAASSPVPAPNPSAGGGGTPAAAARGPAAAAAASLSSASAAVAVLARSDSDVSDSDYEVSSGSTSALGGNIVPFTRRQPRALVLDCAYRPINVLTWYKAFHFDYFGKGEVLEYFPPPAVCTTGSGEHPLPAVLRVPKYTARMQDLCSRVACTRRNVMVRDGFCCQYCGSRRDLTLDHVHPVSKGGKDTWDNLVTACSRCNQKKSDRSLRDLSWKLKRAPKEPSPYEIGIVAGIATSDILRPPPEWESYIAPYRERLETHRRAAVEAGLANLIDEYQ